MPLKPTQEQRIAALEAEVTQLRQQLSATTDDQVAALTAEIVSLKQQVDQALTSPPWHPGVRGGRGARTPFSGDLPAPPVSAPPA